MAGAGDRGHRAADGGARRDHREHRAPLRATRPGIRQQRAAVGGDRLRPRLRQPAAARRPHRRHVQPQGAFGAILAPAALGTLVSTFHEPRERGRAFGVFGSVAAGGGAVGLILGGMLTEYLSWRWCLYITLVFAPIAVAGALA